jgi:cysteinyl-tRNA synthetase
MFISVHYRQKLNYTEAFAENAKRNYEKLKETFEKINFALKSATGGKGKDGKFLKKMEELREMFEEAMDNDLNTPVALKVFHELSKVINKYLKGNKNGEMLEKSLEQFKEFADVFGLKFETNEEKLSEEVEKLIEQREKARKTKNWKEADEIRGRLDEMGIVLEDMDEGVRWKKKK